MYLERYDQGLNTTTAESSALRAADLRNRFWVSTSLKMVFMFVTSFLELLHSRAEWQHTMLGGYEFIPHSMNCSNVIS